MTVPATAALDKKSRRELFASVSLSASKVDSRLKKSIFVGVVFFLSKNKDYPRLFYNNEMQAVIFTDV